MDIFKYTVNEFLLKTKLSTPLYVHFDADLYSSTLYCLLHLNSLKIPYFAFFDEFTGHETRAVYNFCQLTNAKINFYGAVGEKKYPLQVFCKVLTQENYMP